MIPQVWATLPADADDEPCTATLFEGDSYIVELASGEQHWANYKGFGGFVPCDDEGNEIALPGCSCPMALEGVRRVLIRGYAKGFGPSCPRAGEPMKIGLVVIQPSLTDRVIGEVLARIPAAKLRAKQLTERRHDEPITSSERDTRNQESA